MCFALLQSFSRHDIIQRLMARTTLCCVPNNKGSSRKQHGMRECSHTSCARGTVLIRRADRGLTLRKITRIYVFRTLRHVILL